MVSLDPMSLPSKHAVQVRPMTGDERTVRCGNIGFTLIEILAVILILMLLVGIILSTAGHVQKKMGIAATKAQIAAIGMALEAYKSDWGYYPKTNPERISANGLKESTNNWYLYQALAGTCSGCNKRYMNIPTNWVRTTVATLLPNICDSWGTPLNYYNSPTTTNFVFNDPVSISVSGYAAGRQVNVAEYDLFSYGPDKFTYVAGVWGEHGWDQTGYQVNTYPWQNPISGSTISNVWMFQSSALDDISNFSR